jgi:hypothetical protein
VPGSKPSFARSEEIDTVSSKLRDKIISFIKNVFDD